MTHRRIEQQFIAGNLLVAQQMAEATQQPGTFNPLWTAVFRIELAKIYLYQGKSDKVVASLAQPLPPGLDRDEVIRKELLLAFAETRLGHAGLSKAALARAEALQPVNTLHAELLGTQGSIALAQGKLDAAEPLFQSALEEDNRQGATFHATQMWLNLGVVALQLEHYEDALQRFQQGAMLAKAIGARQASEKALGNLGWTYYQTGDFVLAQQNVEAAYQQAKALGAPLDEVRWLMNIGMSQFKNGDRVGARSSYERSLGLAETLHLSDQMQIAHVRLAYLLIHTQPDVAAEHLRQARQLAIEMQDTTGELEPALLESLLLVDKGMNKEAEANLLQLDKQAASLPWVQWEAENTLARLYERTGQDQKAEAWFQRAIATFHQQRLTLKSIELELPFLENGNDLYLDYMEHLIHDGKVEQALEILDRSRAETLAEGLKTSGPSSGNSTTPHAGLRRAALTALAARLHTTILVYCMRPAVSYLWAINARTMDFRTLQGSTTIVPLIERHTQQILASKDLLTQKDSTGRLLYDALIQPAGLSPANDHRVVLIADQGLGSLNFETLIPPGSEPHYWIEDVALTSARSLRLLASLQATRNHVAPHKLLLIGDPLYKAEEFPALPNAAAEIMGVASHFSPQDRTISAKEAASPQAYAASRPEGYGYIHFVAHATANETNPLDSAIILSRPQGLAAEQPLTNRLYARNILKQPLRAELVTISSCYGSGTRNYSGEGVVGLVWAFLRAGAHAVIGASWEVSDVSTPQLMDALYTGLLHGEQPDSALRAAKLAMLHGDGVFRKPLYWASFQLYTGN